MPVAGEWRDSAPPFSLEKTMIYDNFTPDRLYDEAMRRTWAGLVRIVCGALLVLAVGIFWVGQ
jgi:hypothetical protein